MAFSHEHWPDCGVARFLDLIDGPWATLVVRDLLVGPRRFTELRDGLPGISAHTLSDRLKRFETHGIVTRTAFAEIPPRVVYELTDVGRSLRPVLEAMNVWALSVPQRGEVDDLTTGTGAQVVEAGRPVPV